MECFALCGRFHCTARTAYLSFVILKKPEIFTIVVIYMAPVSICRELEEHIPNRYMMQSQQFCCRYAKIELDTLFFTIPYHALFICASYWSRSRSINLKLYEISDFLFDSNVYDIKRVQMPLIPYEPSNTGVSMRMLFTNEDRIISGPMRLVFCGNNHAGSHVKESSASSGANHF